MNEVTGEIVQADRLARGLSRAKYGVLTGLTGTKIHNIEHGRAIREEEKVLLAAVIFGEGGVGRVDRQERFGVADQVAEPIEGEGPVVLDNDEEEESEDYLGVGDEVKAEATEEEDIPDAQAIAEMATPVMLTTKYDFKLEGYHVSNSELQTFKRCRRKWWLSYYRELRLKVPDVTGPRALGTRLHLALSAKYSMEAYDPMEVFESTIVYDRKILSEGTDVEALADLEKEAELGRAMLEGYLQWIAETGADEGFEVVGNEEVVEVPFGEFSGVQVVLVGKMDLRLRRLIDGARLFLDHKSVGDLTSPVKTLHLDEQMLQYHLLEYLSYLADGVAPELVEHSDGGIYNMLKKVKRTVKANPPFFARVEVRHNVYELRSYYMRVWGEVEDIIALRAKLDDGADHRQVAYPRPMRDCSWDCDFIAVCPMFDDGSAAEELLEAYYEKADPHDHYYPMGEREDARSEG